MIVRTYSPIHFVGASSKFLGAGKSVAEISQTLDVTDARVLYHLQRLAQTGVVHLEEDGADPPGMALFASGRYDSRSRVPFDG